MKKLLTTIALLGSLSAFAESVTFDEKVARGLPAILSDEGFRLHLELERKKCSPSREQIAISDESVTLNNTHVVNVVFVWKCANGSTSIVAGNYEVETGTVYY